MRAWGAYIHERDLEVGDEVGKDLEEICSWEIIRRKRREVVQAHMGTWEKTVDV